MASLFPTFPVTGPDPLAYPVPASRRKEKEPLPPGGPKPSRGRPPAPALSRGTIALDPGTNTIAEIQRLTAGAKINQVQVHVPNASQYGTHQHDGKACVSATLLFTVHVEGEPTPRIYSHTYFTNQQGDQARPLLTMIGNNIQRALEPPAARSPQGEARERLVNALAQQIIWEAQINEVSAGEGQVTRRWSPRVEVEGIGPLYIFEEAVRAPEGERDDNPPVGINSPPHKADAATKHRRKGASRDMPFEEELSSPRLVEEAPLEMSSPGKAESPEFFELEDSKGTPNPFQSLSASDFPDMLPTEGKDRRGLHLSEDEGKGLGITSEDEPSLSDVEEDDDWDEYGDEDSSSLGLGDRYRQILAQVESDQNLTNLIRANQAYQESQDRLHTDNCSRATRERRNAAKAKSEELQREVENAEARFIEQLDKLNQAAARDEGARQARFFGQRAKKLGEKLWRQPSLSAAQAETEKLENTFAAANRNQTQHRAAQIDALNGEELQAYIDQEQARVAELGNTRNDYERRFNGEAQRRALSAVDARIAQTNDTIRIAQEAQAARQRDQEATLNAVATTREALKNAHHRVNSDDYPFYRQLRRNLEEAHFQLQGLARPNSVDPDGLVNAYRSRVEDAYLLMQDLQLGDD